MKGFIQGINRNQGTLFPEYLEAFVTEDNPVRVVDVFVEQLDLNQLGFKSVNRVWLPIGLLGISVKKS
jgi:transposase